MNRFLYSCAAALALWLMVWLLLFGPHAFGQPTLDVQIHTTYFVVGSYLGQLLTFLLLLVLMLLLDAGRRRAARRPGWLLVCGSGSALLLCWCAKLTISYSSYPEPPAAFPSPTSMARLVAVIWAVQALLLVVVAWAGITWWQLRSVRSR